MWVLAFCLWLGTSSLHVFSGNSAISPDWRSLLVANLETGMSLYCLETLTLCRSYRDTVDPRTNIPVSVAFLRRGKLVVCGTHTGTIRIWQAATEQIFQTLEHQGKCVICLCYTVLILTAGF